MAYLMENLSAKYSSLEGNRPLKFTNLIRVYRSELFTIFRSTRYHNTGVVDGEEQNSFGEGSFFSMEPDGTVKISRWLIANNCDLLDA